MAHVEYGVWFMAVFYLIVFENRTKKFQRSKVERALSEPDSG